MSNVFKFKNNILNIAPEDILVVAPSSSIHFIPISDDGISNQSSAIWFSKKDNKTADAAEIEIYEANVDTMYDDYVFEFLTEEDRDSFIDNLYNYINNANSYCNTTTSANTGTTKSNSVTPAVKSKPAKKAAK